MPDPKKRAAGGDAEDPTDASGRKFMRKTDLQHVRDCPAMYVDSVEARPHCTWVADIRGHEVPAHEGLSARDRNKLVKCMALESTPGAEGADAARQVEALLHKYSTTREDVQLMLAQAPVPPPQPVVVLGKRQVSYVPALVKIFDEALTNAIDQAKLDASMKSIRVTVRDGMITVRNDGVGLPIGKSMEGSEEEIITDLFGSLRSSSNYDSSTARVTGGQFGLGVKLANIFSSEFVVTVVDPASKKRFEQRWTDGMENREPARITACDLKKGFVQVSFRPTPKFLEPHGSLDGDLTALFAKRTLDACACTNPGVTVYWNDIALPIKTFDKFVELYAGKEAFRASCNSERWNVAVTCSETGFDHTSYCNGVATLDGGTHVEFVRDAIVGALMERIAKSRGGKGAAEVKSSHIREHMWLFVDATIENPSFNSQAKLKLTTPASNFSGAKFKGPKWAPTDAFIEKLYGSDIVKGARAAADAAELVKLSKSGGKKTPGLRTMPKGLEDAHKAGTKGASAKCSLILTEGESAKGFAMAGLKVIGRDYYGVYPLKGKPLNVKDCDVKKQLANKELTDIFQILGLTPGKKYKDAGELRYGSVLVLSDQDHDGMHIRGLVMNILHEHAKTESGTSLLHEGYVRTLRTPLLKAFKGSQVRIFYDYHSAEAFTRGEGANGYTYKFFKGLGSSTPEEARECFEEMKDNLIRYMGDATLDDKMELAFGEARKDDRKTWIRDRIKEVEANPEAVCAEVKTKTKASKGKNAAGPSKHAAPPDPAADVLVSRFIDTELADFSVDSVMRTLPQLMDGLKISQRKVMYVCLKDRLVGERKRQKVFILTSNVAAKTNYHHGNVSLEDTIVRLAQNYVGANNIPLLYPDGAFGTRLNGGKDSAASRYIFTYVPEAVTRIFHPEDAHILNIKTEDGDEVEPDMLLPVVPLILVNGCNGIATGFSTTVLPHTLRDVVAGIRAIMDSTPFPKLTPHWAGFKGTVEPSIRKDKPGGWITKGVWKSSGDTVEITELPVGMWTEAYCEMLKKMKSKGEIRDFTNNSFDDSATFTVRFPSEESLKKLIDDGALEKTLALTSFFSSANMHVRVGPRGIRKFADSEELLRAWYTTRLEAYGRRKESMLARMRARMAALSAKALFVESKIKEPARFDGKRKVEFEVECEQVGVPRLEGTYEFALNVTQRECTLEKVETMRAELRSLADEIKQLEATSLENMWRVDLDALSAAFR